MAFTEADMQARTWLREQLHSAGCAADMDGAGNVIGRLNDGAEGPALVVGSHLDTVPCGGPLDGALGVLCGLECLRRIKEEGLAADFPPIELMAFSDEEGRFSGGFFGSRALVGDLIPHSIYEAEDLDGVTLDEAMKEVGLDPMAALSARRSADSIRAYLELHIEQGPILDSLNVPVGIVGGITGLFRWHVRLIGQADHAGTTPMTMRRDALQGLAEFSGEIPRVLEENGGDESVATIGNVQLFPGSANTVPGQVDFTLDVRDPDSAKLAELADALRRVLSAIGRRRGLMFEFDILSEHPPVQCGENIVETIVSAAEEMQCNFHRMNSGAAHDAGVIAKLAPVGMIFVPSKEGRSHSTAEWTHLEDIEVGANLLLQTLLKLASQSDV